MTIDAHQHFWKYQPSQQTWIDDEMAVIRHDFLPADLLHVYQENGIDGCVAVQADQTWEETNFLLQLAQENDFIKGVIGWVDLQSEKVDEVLSNYKTQKKIKGFRHIVQGEPDHNFLLRPNFMRGISYLQSHRYTYDILVFPHQLGAVLEFVRHFPHQKFVLDHLAKPYIKDGFYDGWALLMREIAKNDNVYCKLSGMITEADYRLWSPEQLQPYMNLVMEAFGPKRILFGSDWPVCLVAGSYRQVKQIVTGFIASLSSAEQNAIMGENAIAFYDL
jgi:L-fuconolactonase